MPTKSFYRHTTPLEDNRQIEEEPLIVNCTGECTFDAPFQTWNREGREDYYLQFVTHGQMEIWVDNAACVMNVGDFLLTKPKTPYRYCLSRIDLPTQGERGKMGYLWVHFTGFHAGRLLSRLQLSCGEIYTCQSPVERVEERFGWLFGEYTNRQRGFDDACAAALTQILVCLSRDVSVDTKDVRKLSTLTWLHAHFTENQPVRELAAMEHLSESRYRSVFRRHTGVSPTEYRIALRMQYACDLLSTSTRSIAEIAAACGYGDVLYFTRLFKEKIKTPPGEYRKRERTKEKEEKPC